jgi:four helix bundle protein
MRYDDWLATVPQELQADALWRRQDYRLSLFAADLGWHDLRKLAGVRSTTMVADQLGRALGSISPNIAEGYSRASGQDRARYYEYALGSARESRDWYHKARHVLGDDVARRRIRILTSVIRLLTVAVPAERRTTLAGRAADRTAM